MTLELSPARVGQEIYSRSLIYFASVAETGSIRETSRRLNIAPSAVSRQLSHLQERLGVTLFDHLGHSLRLAPAGEELLRHYRTIMQELDQTLTSISAMYGARTGTVRVATIDSFATGLLADLMSEFSLAYPSIQISLSIHPAPEVAAQVLEGAADVGFTFNPRHHETLTALFRAECPIGVMVRSDHPLAARPIVTYAECVAHPIGLLKPGSAIRAALEQAASAARLPWPKYVEATSVRFLEELARTGRFVIFQVQYPFMPRDEASELVFVPVEDAQLDRDEFVLVADRRMNPRPAAKCFITHAQTYLRALQRKGG